MCLSYFVWYNRIVRDVSVREIKMRLYSLLWNTDTTFSITVAKRSIVIHSTEGGQPRIACADIIPFNRPANTMYELRFLAVDYVRYVYPNPGSVKSTSGLHPSQLVWIHLRTGCAAYMYPILTCFHWLPKVEEYCFVHVRAPKKGILRIIQRYVFLISQRKHMLWSLIRTVSTRRF